MNEISVMSAWATNELEKQTLYCKGYVVTKIALVEGVFEVTTDQDGVYRLPFSAVLTDTQATETPAAPVVGMRVELVEISEGAFSIKAGDCGTITEVTLHQVQITLDSGLTVYHGIVGLWQSVKLIVETQPAQPLAELEALRAENAQLRAQVGDWMENYEFEKKQHAITELNAQELEAENAALMAQNYRFQDRYDKAVLAAKADQDENEFKSRQIENLANQRDAMQNGMKEKDAAFNELLAERNQLRDALKEAQLALKPFASMDDAIKGVRISAAVYSFNDTELTRGDFIIAGNTFAAINSTLESE